MLDKLVDFLLSGIRSLQAWIVLEPYEEAVLIRLGKPVLDEAGNPKVYKGGFHWCWPFYVDMFHFQSVVPSTHSLGNESVTTKDGKSIGFHAVVTYRISDIQKAILEVHDTDHAIVDACRGEIARTLMNHTWEEIISDGIYEDLTKACRKRGWRWGIEIMAVQLASLSLVKNIRLMQNT